MLVNDEIAIYTGKAFLQMLHATMSMGRSTSSPVDSFLQTNSKRSIVVLDSETESIAAGTGIEGVEGSDEVTELFGSAKVTTGWELGAGSETSLIYISSLCPEY